MKSYKIVVFAAIVLAVLLAAPAAARGPAITTIASGDTIFVFETGLNIAALEESAGNPIDNGDYLVKFVDDDITKARIKEIRVTDVTSFDVLQTQVGSDFGIYYVVDAAAAPSATASSVRIRMMDSSLGVVLNQSHTDSVDGKSITRSTVIDFKIGTQYGTAYSVGGVGYAKVAVEITTPGGAKIRQFQGVDLSAINLSAAEFFTAPGIDLTGAEAGTYSALLKFTQAPFLNQAPNSNSVTFTVLSKPVTITVNKETVVRGRSFVTTVTGESKHLYYVYLKNAAVATGKTAPLVTPGQSNVNTTTAKLAEIAAFVADFNPSGTASAPLGGGVTTAADGTRTMEFNTTTTTDDKKFTVKVVDSMDNSKYDEVDVTVEKGALTITYEGTGTFYLGETVKLSGTNTDSDFVYLFLTGPNLATNGVRVDDLFFASTNGVVTTFKEVAVNADDTWSLKWDTSDLNQTLDSGTYTIYAVAEAKNKGSLSGVTYSTASVVLKKPFITAATNTNTLARGDILYVRGTAEGGPTNVFGWIFGKNYRDCANPVSVRSDATYEWKIDRGTTAALTSGQYYLLMQHPMMNGIPDIISDARSTSCTAFFNTSDPRGTWGQQGTTGGSGGIFVRIIGLQAPEAATALIDALDSPNSDDTYAKLTVMIEEPWINIGEGAGCGELGDKCVGDTFTISGNTNIAEGNEILVTVLSSSFRPGEKTQSGEFSGASGTVTVVKGEPYNTWSFEVDASNFKPDEYIVTAESVQPSVTATHTFNVLDCAATSPEECITLPICTTYPTIPTVPTTEPTTVPPTTPQPQPGFGAVIALIGLGAVAILVLRRH